MKLRKAKIKPFKGATRLPVPSDYEGQTAIEFIEGMGYFLYDDPTSENSLIVSDRMLTYGDLKKMAKRFDIDLDWWNKETDFNDMLTQILDEARF